MRLDERKARDLIRRLQRTDLNQLRDRLTTAINRAAHINNQADGYPHTASGTDITTGGSELTSVEAAAAARLHDSKYVDHITHAFLALDRAVADVDHCDSQLKHAEKLVDPDQTQRVKRCWACAQAGVDTDPDHYCDPGGNLGRKIDVCNACFQYIRRTGTLPPKAVIVARQQQAS